MRVYIVEFRETQKTLTEHKDTIVGDSNVVMHVASSKEKAAEYIRRNLDVHGDKTRPSENYWWWWAVYGMSVDKDFIEDFDSNDELYYFNHLGQEIEDQPCYEYEGKVEKISE